MSGDIIANSVYPEQSKSSNEAVAVTRLSNSFLVDIYRYLHGEVYVEDFDPLTGSLKYAGYIKTGRPLLNEKGINTIMSVVNFYVNQGVWLSHLNHNQIMDLCYQSSRELTKCLVGKDEEYEMVFSWREIKTYVHHAIEISLSKAEDGFTSIQLATQVKSTEQINTTIEQGRGRQLPRMSL